MKILWLTFGFGALSSVIPLFNMEAYLLVAYSQTSHSALLMAVVGSLGQNIGKLSWYYASRRSLNLPFLRRQLDKPKRREQFDRWSAVIQGRPAVAGGLSFVSAAVGVPPFFVMAMIAGTLRMNVVVFFVSGLLGRTLFFWAILGGLHLILR